jgi:hypothetical protein
MQVASHLFFSREEKPGGNMWQKMDAPFTAVAGKV